MKINGKKLPERFAKFIREANEQQSNKNKAQAIEVLERLSAYLVVERDPTGGLSEYVANRLTHLRKSDEILEADARAEREANQAMRIKRAQDAFNLERSTELSSEGDALMKTGEYAQAAKKYSLAFDLIKENPQVKASKKADLRWNLAMAIRSQVNVDPGCDKAALLELVKQYVVEAKGLYPKTMKADLNECNAAIDEVDALLVLGATLPLSKPREMTPAETEVSSKALRESANGHYDTGCQLISRICKGPVQSPERYLIIVRQFELVVDRLGQVQQLEPEDQGLLLFSRGHIDSITAFCQKLGSERNVPGITPEPIDVKAEVVTENGRSNEEDGSKHVHWKKRMLKT